LVPSRYVKHCCLLVPSGCVVLLVISSFRVCGIVGHWFLQGVCGIIGH
jgi:hypothetical protein